MEQITEQQIKVAVIEDHPEIRQGVSFMLNNQEGFTSEAFASAEEALIGIAQSLPDVILMDIGLPGMSGIECTRLVKEKYPNVHILICSSYEEDDKIFAALSAGANGYIVKRAAGNKLFDAIQDIYNGGIPMSSSIARKVVAHFQQVKTIPSVEASTEFSLTVRENEILDLLAQGLRNKEIADKLFVSANTIRTHIYNIYDKLHVQTRVEALNKSGRGFAN